MPVTVYGDGSKYADADAIYGRISAGLLAVQAANVRETALRVSVINRHLNAWEYFAGTTIDGQSFYWPAAETFRQNNIEYSRYRGQAGMCLLSNGHIVRVRNGTDTDVNDRQIWVQEITDPLDPSQWTSWSVLYSGAHYGVSIIADGTSYIVYHPRADGWYRNNVKKYDIDTDFNATAVGGFAMASAPVLGQKDAIYLEVRHTDLASDHLIDSDWYYVEDMNAASTPAYDHTNFRWNAINAIRARLLPDGRIIRVQSNAWYFNPRRGNRGGALTVAFADDISSGEETGPAYLIRGIGGGQGYNYAGVGGIFLLSDGFYYLLTTEVHLDAEFLDLDNIPHQTFWQRSRDGVYWSDPIGTGTNGGSAGLVETDGYVWITDNGSVWRRPVDPTIIDVSNYTTHLDFEIPRDNQPATGEATVANPAGVNDGLLSLSDREIIVEIGLKTPDTGQYEYREWNKWFLTQVDRVLENPAHRLTLTFGDLWARLENPFRDTTNIVGQIAWRDWIDGGRNKSFNYYFLSDTTAVDAKEASLPELITHGKVLYTGWKGLNVFAQAQFNSLSTSKAQMLFRYVDNNNYMFIEYDAGSGDLRLRKKVAGSASTVDTVSVASGDSTPIIGMRIVWGFYDLYFNGSIVLSGFFTDSELILPGYVGFDAEDGIGFYHVLNFSLDEWEQEVTTADLVKRALANGDFHDVKVSSGTGRQLAIIWGPQTDLPSAAAALMQAITSEKLQVIWRDGFVEVGKFTDNSPQRVIQDQLISSSQTDNSGKRINFAGVDGNDTNWLQYDQADLQARDREVNAYFDLPELMDQASVKARAEEEIRLSTTGQSPQGSTPLFFDLWRTDCVVWIDQVGNDNLVRIEGYKVDIDQGKKPHQHQEFDTSIISSSDATSVPIPETAPPPDPSTPVSPPPPTGGSSGPLAPPSSGRPWAAPVITSTVSLSGADATGATDASAAIIAFILAQADGTQINLSATGIYRIDTAIKFNNKHNIIINLNGAEIRCHGTGFTENFSAFYIQQGCSHIAVNGGSIKGTSPTPGSFISGHEGQHGILNDGATYVESGSMTIQGLWGDAFYVGKPSNHTWYHDSHVINTGRNGLSIISGTDTKFESNTLDTMGYMPFDIEPNLSTEPTDGAVIINNTVATWTNAFFAADGAPGAIIKNVILDGNTCTGRSILIIVDVARRTNFRITNNESLVTAAGPVLRFAHVDGLVATGNIQPLSSGVLISYPDCPGAIVNPNP